MGSGSSTSKSQKKQLSEGVIASGETDEDFAAILYEDPIDERPVSWDEVNKLAGVMRSRRGGTWKARSFYASFPGVMQSGPMPRGEDDTLSASSDD